MVFLIGQYGAGKMITMYDKNKNKTNLYCITRIIWDNICSSLRNCFSSLYINLFLYNSHQMVYFSRFLSTFLSSHSITIFHSPLFPSQLFYVHWSPLSSFLLHSSLSTHATVHRPPTASSTAASSVRRVCVWPSPPSVGGTGGHSSSPQSPRGGHVVWRVCDEFFSQILDCCFDLYLLCVVVLSIKRMVRTVWINAPPPAPPPVPPCVSEGVLRDVLFFRCRKCPPEERRFVEWGSEGDGEGLWCERWGREEKSVWMRGRDVWRREEKNVR